MGSCTGCYESMERGPRQGWGMLEKSYLTLCHWEGNIENGSIVCEVQSSFLVQTISLSIINHYSQQHLGPKIAMVVNNFFGINISLKCISETQICSKSRITHSAPTHLALSSLPCYLEAGQGFGKRYKDNRVVEETGRGLVRGLSPRCLEWHCCGGGRECVVGTMDAKDKFSWFDYIPEILLSFFRRDKFSGQWPYKTLTFGNLRRVFLYLQL